MVPGPASSHLGPCAREFMCPSLYRPGSPSQRYPLPILSRAGTMPLSRPRDGDRALPAFETSSVVLLKPSEPPLSQRTRRGVLGPQPLRPQSGRLGRGSDRDRMGTVMGSDLESSDENKSRDTGQKPSRAGAVALLLSALHPRPSPQPPGLALLAASGWGSSGGAPRDPPDPQKLGALGDGPRLGSWPRRRPRLSEQQPRRLRPSPAGCAACAPGGRPALSSGASRQSAADTGAKERGALGGKGRTPGSAPPVAIYAKRVPPRTQAAERPTAPGLECRCVRVWWPGGKAGVCFISLRQKKA